MFPQTEFGKKSVRNFAFLALLDLIITLAFVLGGTNIQDAIFIFIVLFMFSWVVMLLKLKQDFSAEIKKQESSEFTKE